MVQRAVVLLLCLAACAGAIELTDDNWDEKTAGKSIFVTFCAPRDGHCKAMKPNWDKMAGAFEGSTTSVVADVDCTGAGKKVCEKHGVQRFPAIRYGDPLDLKSYQGGRSYKDFKAFADENLGPLGGPAKLSLRSPDRKIKKVEGNMRQNADRGPIEIDRLEEFEYAQFVHPRTGRMRQNADRGPIEIDRLEEFEDAQFMHPRTGRMRQNADRGPMEIDRLEEFEDAQFMHPRTGRMRQNADRGPYLKEEFEDAQFGLHEL